MLTSYEQKNIIMWMLIKFDGSKPCDKQFECRLSSCRYTHYPSSGITFMGTTYNEKYIMAMSEPRRHEMIFKLYDSISPSRRQRDKTHEDIPPSKRRKDNPKELMDVLQKMLLEAIKTPIAQKPKETLELPEFIPLLPVEPTKPLEPTKQPETITITPPRQLISTWDYARTLSCHVRLSEGYQMSYNTVSNRMAVSKCTDQRWVCTLTGMYVKRELVGSVGCKHETVYSACNSPACVFRHNLPYAYCTEHNTELTMCSSLHYNYVSIVQAENPPGPVMDRVGKYAT